MSVLLHHEAGFSQHWRFGDIALAALIIGSATLTEALHRVERPQHPTNKAFDKSGIYSKAPKVADAVIEAALAIR
jgi:hypothetical protein